MITAVVGAGGKTSLIHNLAQQYRSQGKRVLIVTSTHMMIEPDILLTDDADGIIRQLEQTGYAMAGIPTGQKITALSPETYKAVCAHADEVLVEADGSRHLPIKYPIDGEPVIPENTERVIVVCGLHALGKPAKQAAFRLEAVLGCLGIDENTPITPRHIQQLVRKGYMEKMEERNIPVTVHAANDGSLYQRAIAALLEANMDVDLIKSEWFAPKPCLFICGGGHVAQRIADFAALLDFRVKVMDSRAEFANRDHFPHAEEVICDSFENLGSYLEPDSFYTVVTPGHQDDYLCVSTILGTSYRYLGMIGSRGKVAKAFAGLAEAGFTEEQISTIHAPIGLPIGAVTPGEIAVSILAQIIEEKNKRSTASISSELLNSRKQGVLCIIIEKTGSAPRGVGSMMLVSEDGVVDTIGGGPIEHAAIEDARQIRQAAIREYHLNSRDSQRLGMVCGGTNRILFLPV